MLRRRRRIGQRPAKKSSVGFLALSSRALVCSYISKELLVSVLGLILESEPWGGVFRTENGVVIMGNVVKDF